jgi:cyclopropane fatty-acyl-phospholipid synthase-like methyltransferase
MENITPKSKHPGASAARRRRNPEARAKLDALFSEHDFITAYRIHTDTAVLKDPKRAVGGYWEEIGGLQFGYLCENGLQPHHKLLDIGCGTLRGGRHFIRYLDAGNYFGFDISPKAIEYGCALVAEEGLTEKRPDLRAIFHNSLRFEQYHAMKFDYLLAQSVFTHLDKDMIDECFACVGKVMHKESRFFFTFLNSKDHVHFAPVGFSHPYAFFCELADRYGFRIEEQPDYARIHPRKQHMAVIRVA